ncbi:MAG: PilZ domain-containing protein [Gammaproteobacteria bacterium]|nr:PilZ domain-containing protein [Gammaproteobacteria bacterium]
MSISDRKAPRLPIQLDVEFNHQETGVITLVTKNISDTGIFINLSVEKHPPIGTVAKVKLKNDFEDGEEPPTLEMKIVRHSKSGIGLEFIL